MGKWRIQDRRPSLFNRTPTISKAAAKLRRAQELLASSNPYPHAAKILFTLQDLKQHYPILFRGEEIYIWEDLARLFETMNLPDKAVICYRTQAELDPESTDPYLNLGTLYATTGYASEALTTYIEGLRINRNDEYIYYNLSSLLLAEGNYTTALKFINSTILENPERGLNYKLKADIHFNRHEYTQAIAMYEYALQKLDRSWKFIIEDCYKSLIESCERAGDKAKAQAARTSYEQAKKILDLPEGCVLGKLYYNFGELHYEGSIRGSIPYGLGIKYFKSGQKHMEGFFGDWMIEEGKEYYENGHLRFEGCYNKGPRTYYGPRYFVEGKLYYDTGELWYEGTFKRIQVGSMGYPVFRPGESFCVGTEYGKQGNTIKIYSDIS